jgi:SAM-dependent methyltransferase
MNVAFHDHFSALAGRYADFRPHYPAALFDYLATLAPRDSLVWDCACGSGQATIDLAARFRNVIATDGSAEQIASAPRRDNVEYRVALAEHSGIPDASVGLVSVAQALHWFNQEHFFNEVNRVLKPGGVLAVWIYAKNRLENQMLDVIVEDYYTNIVGPYWPPERRMIEQGYSTVQFPLPEITTPSFRMEAQWTLDQLVGYFSSWSATNRFIKANGRNPLPALRETLAEVWGDPDSPRLVVWPLTLRVGRKESPNSE